LSRSPIRSAVLAALLLSACMSVGGGTPIEAVLADDSISLIPAAVPGGTVTLEIRNTADQVHEIEVFAGATPGERPEVVNHVADTRGLVLAGEKEDIVGGTEAKLTLDLEPGTYLVICNLPDHYGRGMVAELVVSAAADDLD